MGAMANPVLKISNLIHDFARAFGFPSPARSGRDPGQPRMDEQGDPSCTGQIVPPVIGPDVSAHDLRLGDVRTVGEDVVPLS